MSVTDATRKALDGLTLDDFGEARAATAIALAEALDASQRSDTGAVMQAVPSIARELRACLDAIAKSIQGEDEFLASLRQPPTPAEVSNA